MKEGTWGPEAVLYLLSLGVQACVWERVGALAFYISASWVVLGLRKQMDSFLSPASTEPDPLQTLSLLSKCRIADYRLPGPAPRALCAPTPLCCY